MTISTFSLTIGGQTKRSKFTPRAVTVDFTTLPEEAQRFVVAYGLKQYLADGTAGASDQSAFNAGIDERLEKLAKADFKRASGERDAKPDTPEGRAFKLAKVAIRQALKDQGKKAEKEQIEAGAKKLASKFLAEAKRQLEAERKAAQTVTEAEGDDILAGLFGDDDDTDESADDTDNEGDDNADDKA